MSRSLRRRLSLWIAGVTILSGLAAGICSFYLAFREAQELQDEQLSQVTLLVERSGKTPGGMGNPGRNGQGLRPGRTHRGRPAGDGWQPPGPALLAA